jgi:hypothetical protein
MERKTQRSQQLRVRGVTTSTRKKDFKVIVNAQDKPTLTYTLQWQKWINPPLTNEEILDKRRMLSGEVVDGVRLKRIESLVLRLEECEDTALLREPMASFMKNLIA